MRLDPTPAAEDLLARIDRGIGFGVEPCEVGLFPPQSRSELEFRVDAMLKSLLARFVSCRCIVADIYVERKSGDTRFAALYPTESYPQLQELRFSEYPSSPKASQEDGPDPQLQARMESKRLNYEAVLGEPLVWEDMFLAPSDEDGFVARWLRRLGRMKPNRFGATIVVYGSSRARVLVSDLGESGFRLTFHHA